MAYPYYVPYFHQILLDNGKVYVDGMGTFLLERTSAVFGNKKSFISPPSTHVSFRNGVYDGISLSTALSEAGLEKDVAKSIEHNIANDYQASIANNVAFDIQPLATIENGALLNVNAALFNKYEGLQDIQTSVLGHDVERAYVQKTKMANEQIQLQPMASYQPSWKDYLVPLLVIVSLLAVIYIWYDSSKMLAPKSHMQVQYAVKPVETRTDQASISNDQMLNEVDSILSATKGDKGNDQPSNASIASSEPNTIKKSGGVKSTNSGTSKPIINTRKAPKKLAGSPKTITDNPTIESAGSCVIIVGAFKNSNNASRLMKRLRQKGYQTYTENSQGLQRVGIAYNCAVKDTEVFKNEIRRSLNPDAWNLKDSI